MAIGWTFTLTPACRLSNDGLSGTAGTMTDVGDASVGGAAGTPAGGAAGTPAAGGAAGTPAAGGAPAAAGAAGTPSMRLDASADVVALPCPGATATGKPPGQPCACAGECATGFCVDGVCCQEACTGACRTCASGSGTCGAVPAGQRDPRGVCADQPAETCGTTGLCAAQGQCAKHPVGTMCAAARGCEGTSYRGASRCDDRGTCAPAIAECAPYRCGGNGCETTCNGDADCAPGLTCQNHACTGRRANGAACGAANECLSGFCVDGACCSTTCDGTCRSCALPGTRGTCTLVPANAVAARGECAVQPASSCGTNGTCNGQGQCNLYAAGTTCASGDCSNGTRRAASTCDGSGRCIAGATNSCAPYSCGAMGQCLDRCGADPSCASPNVCVSGRCALDPILDVPLAVTPPRADGVVEDAWKLAPVQNITHLVFGTPQTEAAATFRVLWSTAGLHLLVVVPDAMRVNDDAGMDSYDDDTVEVYLDADGSRAAALDGVNDHHFLFGYRDTMPANVSLRRIEGIGFGQTESAQGYTIELTLPWTTLGVQPKSGAVIGLDVHVDDDDDGGNRERKLAWFGTEDVAFRDPSAYGRIRLAP